MEPSRSADRRSAFPKTHLTATDPDSGPNSAPMCIQPRAFTLQHKEGTAWVGLVQLVFTKLICFTFNHNLMGVGFPIYNIATKLEEDIL